MVRRRGGAFRHLILGAYALLLTAGVSLAAETVRVAVVESPPFVILENGIWSGYSIDIWQEVAELNAWGYTITGYPDTAAAQEALLSGKEDIIVSNVPITSDGMKLVDFSQPYFLSGLQIMVDSARRHSFSRLLENLMDWEHLPILWGVIIIVALFTVAVTLFERMHNPDFPKTWHEGLAEAFYYVISLALTGKSTYKGFPGVLGRLMLVVWMILGVVTVVFLTSSVTTMIAAEKMRSELAGPQNLPGKTVGAVKDSRALDYLQRHGINRVVYPTLPEAVDGLLRRDVRAIVDAAPLLQYYDNTHTELSITEVGPVFSRYAYGFALAKGSPFRLPLNIALLRLQEKGAVEQIGRKYFGAIYLP